MAGYTTRKLTAEGKAFEYLKQQLKKKPYVSIGVQGSEGQAKEDGGSLTVAQIAAIHEFGSSDGKIPERSFIRSNDAKNGKKYAGIVRGLKNDVILGKIPIEKALAKLGLIIENDIKLGIREGIAPPLKPQTIARKGSSTPLIDTGQMINAIKSVVHPEGDAGGE